MNRWTVMKAQSKMTAALQDMYPKFVETLKDESYYYSLVEKFYTKIMLVDTEKHYRFTNEQRNRINSAVLGLFKITKKTTQDLKIMM